MKDTFVLELSLTGSTKENCSLGHAKISTSLCLSCLWIYYIYDVDPGIEGMEFRMCVTSEVNFGEDRLVWTSEVTTNYFHSERSSILIDLPRKISDAQMSISDSCCINALCESRYIWVEMPEYLRPMSQYSPTSNSVVWATLP